MKQGSRIFLAEYLAIGTCMSSCSMSQNFKRQRGHRSRYSSMSGKCFEISISLETKLEKSKRFLHQRSRSRRILTRCFKGRTSRSFKQIETVEQISLPSQTCHRIRLLLLTRED